MTASLHRWTFNGVPAADLGISGLVITRRSQAADTATFEIAAPFDGALPFAHGDMVSIRCDGAQRFYGRVVAVPRVGRPDTERLVYTLAGPWWHLEHCVMEELSMGMSQDYGVAIEEGATIVRIGRLIFGERPARG